ncbi:MAG: ATP-dependent Clp protease ATP-binding subunit [Anaerolineae bacterium]|nr:ATP-dependent Clp protease ATP-binding subunit [Anaerolineae bacterium]
MGTLNPNHLSEEVRTIMNKAAVRMGQFRHTVLSAELVLDTIIEDGDNSAYWLLRDYQEERGLDFEGLKSRVSMAARTRRAQRSNLDYLDGDGYAVRLSQDMVQALDRALDIAQAAGEDRITAYDLLWSMTDRRVSTSGLLRMHGMTAQYTGQTNGRGAAPARTAERTAGRGDFTDLVALARAGDRGALYFRDDLLRSMVNIISQKETHHLILAGLDGVGKRTLVECLAYLIVEGQGPPGVDKLVRVEEPALLKRPLQALQAALNRARGGILFLPHVHRFFGGPIKAAAFYKDVAPEVENAFHNMDPIIIGSTTEIEYGERLAGIPAIAENSQMLRVPPASEEETVKILEGRKTRMQKDYGLEIDPDALPVAVSMARRYLSVMPLPRAAEQLLHRTCSIVSLIPTSQAEPERRVDAEDVTVAISQMTGIPASKLGVDERSRYASMVEHLHERIVGQDEAVQAISRAVKTARVGLKDPKRPIGSFLFLGPTGVGKTELAKALAEFMFDDESAMLQLDMSEFQNESTVNRLLGSPSGYIDSEAGGQLTERVRQQPYLIVLFDEVEKAHARVLDILLQVMEEGRLTDGRGNVANFSETVVIMTSNLGAQDLAQPDIVDETGHVREEVREAVMEEVNDHFRPEFLNRLTEIVLFHPLNSDHLAQILDLMLKKDVKLAADRGLVLQITPAAKLAMLAQNDHPEWGARPLRRIIDRTLREPLADFMLQTSPGPGTTIVLDAEGQRTFFTIKQDTPPAQDPFTLRLGAELKYAGDRDLALDITAAAEKNLRTAAANRELEPVIDQYVHRPLISIIEQEKPAAGAAIVLDADEEGLFFEVR